MISKPEFLVHIYDLLFQIYLCEQTIWGYMSKLVYTIQDLIEDKIKERENKWIDFWWLIRRLTCELVPWTSSRTFRYLLQEVKKSCRWNSVEQLGQALVHPSTSDQIAVPVDLLEYMTWRWWFVVDCKLVVSPKQPIARPLRLPWNDDCSFRRDYHLQRRKTHLPSANSRQRC